VASTTTIVASRDRPDKPNARMREVAVTPGSLGRVADAELGVGSLFGVVLNLERGVANVQVWRAEPGVGPARIAQP